MARWTHRSVKGRAPELHKLAMLFGPCSRLWGHQYDRQSLVLCVAVRGAVPSFSPANQACALCSSAKSHAAPVPCLASLSLQLAGWAAPKSGRPLPQHAGRAAGCNPG